MSRKNLVEFSVEKSAAKKTSKEFVFLKFFWY